MHDAVVDADAAGCGGGEDAFGGGVVAGIDVHRQRIFATVHEVNGFIGWTREGGKEGGRKRERIYISTYVCFHTTLSTRT